MKHEELQTGRQNSLGDVKHSIGNIVNNIVMTVYGARWALEISEDTLCKV